MVTRFHSEGKEIRCIHCQGEMKRSHTPFHVDRRGFHVTLDQVPAWVCGQCSEAYFEEKEVDSIQKLLAEIDQQLRTLALTA
jgi:YgiT-type zinc finger domain-containing protein